VTVEVDAVAPAGVNFINILRAAFTQVGHKREKDTVDSFLCIWELRL